MLSFWTASSQIMGIKTKQKRVIVKTLLEYPILKEENKLKSILIGGLNKEIIEYKKTIKYNNQKITLLDSIIILKESNNNILKEQNILLKKRPKGTFYKIVSAIGIGVVLGVVISK